MDWSVDGFHWVLLADASTQTTTFKDSSHILKAPGSMFCLDLVRYLSIKKSIEVNPPRSETAKRITFTNCSKCQTHFENPKFCLSAKENLCDDKWLRKESSSAPLTSSGHLFTTVSNFGMESFAILEFIRAKSTWKPNQILWKIIENELHLFLTFGHLEISRKRDQVSLDLNTICLCHCQLMSFRLRVEQKKRRS